MINAYAISSKLSCLSKNKTWVIYDETSNSINELYTKHDLVFPFVYCETKSRKKKKTSPFLTYRYNFPSHKKIIKILIISGK